MAAQTATAAEQFLEALGQRDFARIEACFAPDVRFRALVPSGMREAKDPAAVAAYLRHWFGGADEFQVVRAEVGRIAGRIRIAYRLRVCDEDGWQVVEQQAYCDLADEQIARMDLLCSGFQPESAAVPAASGSSPMDSLPVPDAVLDAPGETCATLTPLVRARLRDLPSGAVLELHTDDPAAPASLAAWCRLTGNELVATRGHTFYLRKK
jgi:tRNA 2-thiouridine synthesizing protein A